jgi:hypothetical protein
MSKARNVPDNLLAIATLISTGSSSGSGLVFRTDRFAYLVTAKHVLFDEKGDLRVQEIEIVNQTTDISDDSVFRLAIDFAVTIPKFHYAADVAVVKIGRVRLENKKPVVTYVKGVQRLERGVSKPFLWKQEDVSRFDDVLISNEVYISGYPTSLGIRSSAQFDYNKPLLRRGIVAGIYKQAKTIILDCPVYYGNSGGPVIQVVEEAGKKVFTLIGVISQYIPFVQTWKNDREKLVHTEYLNSGYSVATSFDLVVDLIFGIEAGD